MGKINLCLKCVFIIFNSLFVIFGSVEICGAMWLSINSYQLSWFLVLPWMVAIAIFGISSLGIYAACSENICALKTFAGFMGTGLIFMLICGFVVVANKQDISQHNYEAFEITAGISFGLSTIALMGLLISIFMIHQIKRHDSSAGEYSMVMKGL